MVVHASGEERIGCACHKPRSAIVYTNVEHPVRSGVQARKPPSELRQMGAFFVAIEWD